MEPDNNSLITKEPNITSEGNGCMSGNHNANSHHCISDQYVTSESIMHDDQLHKHQEQPNPEQTLLDEERFRDNTMLEDTKEHYTDNKDCDNYILTERPVLTQEDVNDLFDDEYTTKSRNTFCQFCSSNCTCSMICVKRSVLGFFPFISIMRNYNVRTDLLCDLIAGITIGIMQVPQGMAYAMLASVGAVYGLYTSLFPVVLYFFLGTSRHVSVGTFAVVSLMVGSVVDKFDCSTAAEDINNSTILHDIGVNDITSHPNDITTMSSDNTTLMVVALDNSKLAGGLTSESEMSCKIGVATALTFLSGLVQITLGVMRLGFVTMYLGEPLIRGFTTGCAVFVFTSQLKALFGVNIGRYSGPWKVIYTYRDLFVNIQSTSVATIVTSSVCIVIIYISKQYIEPLFRKRLKTPFPIDLIVMISAAAASHYGEFDSKFNMNIIGKIPTGIPPPVFPPTRHFTDLFVDALELAVVSYAISISMAQLYATKHNYVVDSNQELIAQGICNTVSSNFHCIMSAVSLSRSAVLDSIGCKTQLMGLISSVLILIVLYTIGPLLEPLPTSALAAIIVVALKGLFAQFSDLSKYWRYSRIDLAIWIVAFIAVVLLDVALGLAVGIGFQLLTIVGRTQRPRGGVMGKLPQTDLYKNLDTCKQAQQINGIKIVNFDGPLYFASRDHFISLVQGNIHQCSKTVHDTRVKAEQKQDILLQDNNNTDIEDDGHARPDSQVSHVIINCTSISWLDTMGVTTLKEVYTDCEQTHIKMYLAGCNDSVLEMLHKVGYFKTSALYEVFPTVHDAVVHSLSGRRDKQTYASNTMMKREVSDAKYTFETDSVSLDGDAVRCSCLDVLCNVRLSGNENNYRYARL